MASKKKSGSISQKELLKQLCDAGYELDGFERKPGNNLVIRLTPTNLIEDGQHIAESVCQANGLQARCNVFAETTRPLLIVTVKLPEEKSHASTVTPHDEELSD